MAEQKDNHEPQGSKEKQPVETPHGSPDSLNEGEQQEELLPQDASANLQSSTANDDQALAVAGPSNQQALELNSKEGTAQAGEKKVPIERPPPIRFSLARATQNSNPKPVAVSPLVDDDESVVGEQNEEKK